MRGLGAVFVVLVLAALAIGYWKTRSRKSENPGRPARKEQPAPVVSAEPDAPEGFGYKTAWIAVRTNDPESVLSALGSGDAVPSNWASGEEVIYGDKPRVFVSPPVQGWVLVAGRYLWGDETGAQPWLVVAGLLAPHFSEVQYFGTYRVSEFHAWARYRNGELVRSYAYIGERGETLDDRGPQTDEEVKLGFRFFNEHDAESDSESYWERSDLDFPDEQNVMDLARLWSLDPNDLPTIAPSPSVGWIKDMRRP